MVSKKTTAHVEYGHKPNVVIYDLVSKLSKLYLKFKYNIIIEKDSSLELNTPFIALGNHPSKLDPFIMAAALYPIRINFLGTNYYFRNRLLGPIFKAGGIIPKVQFYRDINAVRAMNRVISRGGSLGIFPEGRRSLDGSPSEISIAIAKLIKLYKVPVIAVVSDGNYLSLPRWAAFSRRGKIEVHVRPVLTAEEVKNLSLEEILVSVKSSLFYNDYAWNRKYRISFKHKKIAENIDFVLNECPSCNKENAMRSKNNRLFCRFCGNAALINEYGLMEPETESCCIFEDSVKWFEWQQMRTSERVMDSNFSITSKVKELWVAEGLTGSYRKSGMGKIELSRKGLIFKGLVNGVHKEMFFPPQVLSSIVSELGVNFEITDGKITYRFDLEDGQDAIRYELAVAEINNIASREAN